jgi:AcrR family transcriptional regulator
MQSCRRVQSEPGFRYDDTESEFRLQRVQEVPVSSSAKPLRADARRNRVRLLEAAEVVLAAEGPAASIEAIARHAGVGIGTVYRHFPTKEALLEAIIVQRYQRLLEETETLTTDEDPGAAFERFFTRVVEESAAKKAVAAPLASAGVDVHAATAEVGRELMAAFEMLLDRAQRAGAVRADVSGEEVRALLIGASLAAEQGAGMAGGPDVRARALEILFDGLRAGRGALTQGREP